LSGPTPFTAYNFGNVSAWTGAQLEAASKNGTTYRVTSFNRPEDGAWDPSNPNDFYFVTTAAFNGNSRLWKLHFNDPANPAAGGTAEILFTGPATTTNPNGPKMMDNITINDRGQIVIQEDPGNQPYVAKIWRYDIATGTMEGVARHDPDRFTPGAAGFLTQDEESSGVIDASSILGEGWYLLDQQAHYPTDAELVEGGQLLVLHIPPGKK
jgi:secreted PhoX family phosphatase